MPAISACVSNRFTLPGLPITSDFGGTFMFSASSVPAATIEPVPTWTPLRRIAPMPIRHWFSIVQPWTMAPCPIVTLSPIVVGCVPLITWTTVPSWMLVRRPTRIALTSPRRTAPIHTPLSSPMSTSPITWALSSMNAVGWMRGDTPRYARSTLNYKGGMGRRGWTGHASPSRPSCLSCPVGARKVAEDGRVRLAGRPAVRAALFGDCRAKLPAPIASPQRLEVEAVLPQVADALAPDRAREQVPVGVDETGGRQRRARQRRLAGFVVVRDQRLIPIFEEL